MWNKIQNEIGESSPKDPNYFVIDYRQMMGNKHIKVGTTGRFEIQKGLSIEDKRAVALSIFLNVSKNFEDLQSNWLFRHFTDSGYSAEDLVSDLIGFYRAVFPNMVFVESCEPVAKDVALKIWDTYGAVGSNKNFTTVPYIFPLPGTRNAGPMSASLPFEFNRITPATPGTLFRQMN